MPILPLEPICQVGKATNCLWDMPDLVCVPLSSLEFEGPSPSRFRDWTMTSGKKGGVPVIFSLRGVHPGSSQKEYPRFFRVHVCGSEGIQVRMRDYGYQRKHPREVPLQKPVRKIIVSEEKPSFQNYKENTGFGRRAFVLIFARVSKSKTS